MPRLRGRKEEPTNTDQNQLIPTKVERPPSPPAPKVYAFQCGKVRLLEKDFERWKAIYPNLDLAAELQGMADWASRQENWFVAASGLLAKRNREQAAKLKEAEARGRYSGNNGTSRVIM